MLLCQVREFPKVTLESRVFFSVPSLQFWIFRLSFISHTRSQTGVP